MVLATLTGILMGVQSRNPTMRKVSIILVAISALFVILMVMNR